MKKSINKTKTVSVDISSENQEFISKILIRTGETKVDLFNRLVASEYKRIVDGDMLPENINSNIESLSKTINDIVPVLNKVAEVSSATREGANKVYVAVLVVLKELIRSIYILNGAFSKSSLLKSEQLTIISSDADKEATNTFNKAFKLLSEERPLDVIDALRGH
jgi:hypothetical protein